MLANSWVNVTLTKIEGRNIQSGNFPNGTLEVGYEWIERLDWESCADVLADDERRRTLEEEW